MAVPVFSLRTRDSCGCGEFLDLLPLIDWSNTCAGGRGGGRGGFGFCFLPLLHGAHFWVLAQVWASTCRRQLITGHM